MAKKEYPFVTSALFCDRIITESDKTSTLVRVIDRLTIKSPLDQIPKGTVYSCSAFIKFVAGPAKGAFKFSMTLRSPSGKETVVKDIPEIVFSGGHNGFAMHAQIAADASIPGVYWHDIRLDDRLMTSMPLEIVFEKVTEQPPTPQSSTLKKKRLLKNPVRLKKRR